MKERILQKKGKVDYQLICSCVSLALLCLMVTGIVYLNSKEELEQRELNTNEETQSNVNGSVEDSEDLNVVPLIVDTEENEIVLTNASAESNISEESEEERKFNAVDSIPMSDDWQEYAYNLCEEKEIPFALVCAVIESESGFNPDAVSYDGKDHGLMQIREINHGWLNEELGYTLDYKNPYDNVLAGVTMLSRLYEKNGGNIINTLMCYNMGEGGASKAWESGVYNTQYTDKVNSRIIYWEGELNK